MPWPTPGPTHGPGRPACGRGPRRGAPRPIRRPDRSGGLRWEWSLLVALVHDLGVHHVLGTARRVGAGGTAGSRAIGALLAVHGRADRLRLGGQLLHRGLDGV